MPTFFWGWPMADEQIDTYSPPEEWKAVKVGEICLVTEVNAQNGSESFYGAWETEAQARHDYGDEATPYKVRFETFPLWGMRHVG